MKLEAQSLIKIVWIVFKMENNILRNQFYFRFRVMSWYFLLKFANNA